MRRGRTMARRRGRRQTGYESFQDCQGQGVSYHSGAIRELFKGIRIDGGEISVPEIGGGIEGIVKGTIEEILIKFLPVNIVGLTLIILFAIKPIVDVVSGVIVGIVLGLLGVIPGGSAILAAIVGIPMGRPMVERRKSEFIEFINKVSSYDLPMLVRNAVAEQRIKDTIYQETRDLSDTIANRLISNSVFRNKLPRELSSCLQKIVKALTDQMFLKFTR